MARQKMGIKIRCAFLVSLMILNFGCYSYFEINRENFVRTQKSSISKIELVDGRTILTDTLTNFSLNVTDSVLVIENKGSITFHSFEEIDKCYTYEPDNVKSIVSTILIIGGSIFLIKQIDLEGYGKSDSN